MKMKKLIALAVCAVMASSTAFAATTPYKDDIGAAAIEVWGTYEDVTTGDAYSPVADIKVETVTAAVAKAGGLSLGMGTSAKNDTNADFYKITVNITNMGDLYYAYTDPGDYSDMAQVRLFGIDVKFPGVTAVKEKEVAGSSSFAGINWENQVTGNYGIRWMTAMSADAYIPVQTYDADNNPMGDYILNASTGEAVFYIATDPHTEDQVVTPTVELSYYVGNKNEDTQAGRSATLKNGSVTFAADKPAAADPIDFSAVLAEKEANGYIWVLTFTEYENLATLKAKFEAAEGTADREISNVNAVVTALKALGGASAPIELNVGLDTTKTLTKATFTGDDADDETTEPCVVVAPLTKAE